MKEDVGEKRVEKKDHPVELRVESLETILFTTNIRRSRASIPVSPTGLLGKVPGKVDIVNFTKSIVNMRSNKIIPSRVRIRIFARYDSF